MYVIRPVKLSDLDSIESFASATALGMSSLPRNRSILKERIEQSLASFNKAVSIAGDEMYFFALEDSKTQVVAGCCGIFAKTGIVEPYYYFHIENLHLHSAEHALVPELRVLHPIVRTNGPSELCALYLTQALRKEGLGELLSLSRLLFVATFPERFTNEIIGRLRGFINKKSNSSPFWDGLGKHFLNIPYMETQHLLESGKNFIAEFLPKYPIYATFLSPQAQAVIGQPHSTTWPALKMLQKEGFSTTSEIDIFDGGPTVMAKKNKIRTIKDHVICQVVEVEEVNNGVGELFILSNNSQDFRAVLAKIVFKDASKVVISKETANVLQVEKGSTIRCITRHRSH